MIQNYAKEDYSEEMRVHDQITTDNTVLKNTPQTQAQMIAFHRRLELIAYSRQEAGISRGELDP